LDRRRLEGLLGVDAGPESFDANINKSLYNDQPALHGQSSPGSGAS
jgi:hypothetical protein